MAQVRTDFNASDSSRIWELLNPIGVAVNPYIRDTGIWNFATASGTLNGGTTALNGGVLVQRQGNLVTVQGNLNVSSGSSWINNNWNGWNLLSFPDGFKPTYRNYKCGVGTWYSASVGSYGALFWNNDTNMIVVASTLTKKIAAGNSLSFTCVWPTNQAFPADGSIPGDRVS